MTGTAEHANLTSIHLAGPVQSTDPGAIGAGKLWVDSTILPYTIKVRNGANNGWIVVDKISGLLTTTGDIVYASAANTPARLAVGAALALLRTNSAGTLPEWGSAGQIAFPATQNPSANANTLDDYEEGTWTPSDASGAGLSFTVTNATYLKIGGGVYIRAHMSYPVTANAANASISGAPYTVATITPCSLLSGETTAIVVLLLAGGIGMDIRGTGNTNLTNLTLSGDLLIFSGWYAV